MCNQGTFVGIESAMLQAEDHDLAWWGDTCIQVAAYSDMGSCMEDILVQGLAFPAEVDDPWERIVRSDQSASATLLPSLDGHSAGVVAVVVAGDFHLQVPALALVLVDYWGYQTRSRTWREMREVKNYH